MFLYILLLVVLFYSHEALGVSQTAENEGKIQDQKDKDQREHICRLYKLGAWAKCSMKSQIEAHVSIMHAHIQVSLFIPSVTTKECPYFSQCVFSPLFTSEGFLSVLCPEALHLSSYVQVTRNG